MQKTVPPHEDQDLEQKTQPALVTSLAPGRGGGSVGVAVLSSPGALLSAISILNQSQERSFGQTSDRNLANPSPSQQTYCLFLLEPEKYWRNFEKFFPKCSLWKFYACIRCVLFTPTSHYLPTSHVTSQHIYLSTSSLLFFNSIYWFQLVLAVCSQGLGHPLEHGPKEKWPPTLSYNPPITLHLEVWPWDLLLHPCCDFP